MVSPVSGLRSRGGGVVPSGEAGDEASVEALSRRGVPAERDSESCAYGERACDVAVGCTCLYGQPVRVCTYACTPSSRRGVNSDVPPPPPLPVTANLVDLPFKVRSMPLKPPRSGRSGEPPGGQRLLS